MNTLPRPRPLVVVILDGWGISFLPEGNAIAAAKTPHLDYLARHFPAAALSAASIEVGLPWGEVGNSETGHRNIGAGQVQYQVLPTIDRAIQDGSFGRNPILRSAIDHAVKHTSSLHLIGLVSPGGVHSHIEHLFALLKLCQKLPIRDRVYIHMFTDGRDSPPQIALQYLEQLEQAIGATGTGKIASVTGRFYAMDRNKNWERTQATYSMLTGGPRASGAPSAREAIQQAYDKNIFDEMIPPTAITRGGGPLAPIRDNDAMIFFNFRPDRARQLTQAFMQPEFAAFPVTRWKNLKFVTLAEYDPLLSVPAAYKEEKADYPLARVLSEAELTQLHIAETEKYAHVTYYLNVGHESPFPGETYKLVRSSGIKSFADMPEMAAKEITDHLVETLQAGTFDVYFVNYANADMVGHTGNFEATVKACAFIDVCLGRLWAAVQAARGAMIVTADHGNAEEKINHKTQQIQTDHTSNPVPFYYLHPQLQRTVARSDVELQQLLSAPIGVLADVAPTILEILHVPKPPTMTGYSLLNSLQ
jgi:2,3-bisphosphoglycerate-independent phosphoglycerate mutase